MEFSYAGKGPSAEVSARPRQVSTYLCPTELGPHRPLDLASQESTVTIIQGLVSPLNCAACLGVLTHSKVR